MENSCEEDALEETGTFQGSMEESFGTKEMRGRIIDTQYFMSNRSPPASPSVVKVSSRRTECDEIADSGSLGITIASLTKNVKSLEEQNLLTPSTKYMINNNVSPPLPLMRFKAENLQKVQPVGTINGETIPHIPNNFYPEVISVDRLCDPLYSRKLIKWFTARSQKETNYRQMESFDHAHRFFSSNNDGSKAELVDCVVYECLLYSETLAQRTAKSSDMKKNETAFREKIDNLTQTQSAFVDTCKQQHASFYRNYDQSTINDGLIPVTSTWHSMQMPSLSFDGEFESGNVEKVVRVVGRESLMNTRTIELLHDYIPPTDVDQEYDVILRKDVNTDGNTQWYYFSAKAPDQILAPGIKYPLKVRFNIINLQKKDSLYNYGMKPAIFSKVLGESKDWFHGGSDICYYRNGLTYLKFARPDEKKKMSVKYHYTLTFTYEFTGPDTVYFAHTYPYTYSDLQSYLNTLETDPKITAIMHRRNLVESLAGNRCELLTITERAQGIVETNNKPGIILSARVHAGESNSSYILHGLLDFLLSDTKEAYLLRRSFIFTVLPMLNPDGVIHGNYRCSLAGTDLNRRYGDAHESLHPTIVASRKLIQGIQQRRGVLLYLDIHGHSKHKNAFLYGCDLTQQTERITKMILPALTPEEIGAKRIFSRTFPKVLCTISDSQEGGYFSYRDCSFVVDKSKYGTGRVVCWKDFCIPGSYTIEASFCGNGDNHELKLLKKVMESQKGHSKANRLRDLAAPSADSNSGRHTHAPDIRSYGRHAATDTDALNLALNELLESYNNAYHYTKQDLLNMGRDVAIAIYHFANLSHSNVEAEVRYANELDQLEKLRRMRSDIDITLFTGNNGARRTFETEGFARSPGKEPASRRMTANTVEFNNILEGKQFNSGPKVELMKRRHTSFKGKALEAQIEAKRISPTNMKDDDREKGNKSPDDLENSIGDLDCLDDDDDGDGDADNEEDGDEDDDDKDVDTGKKASLSVEATKLSVNHCHDDDQWLNFKMTVIDALDDSMRNRSLLRNAMFKSSALEKLMQTYPSEFLVDEPTENVGMRLKCELHVRRGLKLDSDIMFDPRVKIATKADLPEEGDEDNGSESDPSGDNVPAPKLLKNLGKYQDTKSLVAALRRAALKKKKKELQLERRREKRRVKLLEKQRKEAEKALAEAAALKAAEEAAATEAAATAAEKLANERRFSVRKKSSVVSNLYPTISADMPKFIPTYKQLPEEKQAMSIQVRNVNFGEDTGRDSPDLISGAVNVVVTANGSYSQAYSRPKSAAPQPQIQLSVQPQPNPAVILNLPFSASVEAANSEGVNISIPPPIQLNPSTAARIILEEENNKKDINTTRSASIRNTFYKQKSSPEASNAGIRRLFRSPSIKDQTASTPSKTTLASIPKSLEEYFESVNNETMKRRSRSSIVAASTTQTVANSATNLLVNFQMSNGNEKISSRPKTPSSQKIKG